MDHSLHHARTSWMDFRRNKEQIYRILSSNQARLLGSIVVSNEPTRNAVATVIDTITNARASFFHSYLADGARAKIGI